VIDRMGGTVGVLIGATLLSAACASVPCEDGRPGYQQACYECTREAVRKRSEADPHTGARIDVNEEITACLRERGYPGFRLAGHARP